MSKFTKTERQYIKGVVNNLSLQRLTDQDIVDYLHNTKGIDLTRRMVTLLRTQAEQEAEGWYIELKDSRHKLIAFYKDRLDSLLSYEKKLHEILSSDDRSDTSIRAIAELHRIEMSIFTLLKEFPEFNISANDNNGKPECYGEGCSCSHTSMDNRTHSVCKACSIMWCHSTYHQDWCPNPSCWLGIKGADGQPYDEHNIWVECSGCKQWFKKQAILDIHRQTCNPNTIHVEAETEAPEWVDTKPVSIPKEQPQLINQITNVEEEIDEGPKEGDVIGRPWTPAEAYKALKKSKAGSNTETTTTSF